MGYPPLFACLCLCWCCPPAASSQDLYLIGGLPASNKEALGSGEHYHTAAHTWSPLPPMPVGRANASATPLNGKVCVVGGDDGLFPLDAVHCFDPFTKKWMELAGLSVKRSGCAAGTCGVISYYIEVARAKSGA